MNAPEVAPTHPAGDDRTPHGLMFVVAVATLIAAGALTFLARMTGRLDVVFGGRCR